MNSDLLMQAAQDTVTDGGRIDTIDEVMPNLHKFTSAAILANSKKVHSLLVQRNELLTKGDKYWDPTLPPEELQYIRVVDVVRFMGVTAQLKDKELALDLVIDQFNKIAEQGIITGVLLPMASFNMRHHDYNLHVPSNDEHVAIFVYFAVDYKHDDRIQSTYKKFFFSEGAVPPSLENFKEELFNNKFDEEFKEVLTQ